MKKTVTTTSLEMTVRAELRPAAGERQHTLMRAELPSPALNRFLYTAVGARYAWYSRLSWDYARWMQYLSGPVETWVAYVQGTPAGYFELEHQAQGSTEIAFFGLLPGFVGRGMGGQLLTDTIARAWDAGATRVWVHTCDLDHPQALRNYQARGFRVFKVETDVQELPDGELEAWPGANGTP